MESMSGKLKSAQKRNPNAYSIISAVAGMRKKRIKEIAEGSEMSVIERVILDGLSMMEE